MKGYKLSFFLATALIIGAFVSKAYAKKTFGNLKSDDTGSWFLFLGGVILLGVGYREYVRTTKK